MRKSVRALLFAAAVMLPIAAAGQTAGGPLELEAKIPLGAVSGRIAILPSISSGNRFSSPSSGMTVSGSSILRRARCEARCPD